MDYVMDGTVEPDGTTSEEIDGDSALPVSRKTLLIGLACFAGFAVVLAIINGRRSQPVQDDMTVSDAIATGDWKVSLEHLAGAFELRLQLMEQAIKDIANDRVAHATIPVPIDRTGTYVAPAPPAAPAAVSEVPPPLVEPEPMPEIPHAAEIDNGPPPAPAAVSVMPSNAD